MTSVIEIAAVAFIVYLWIQMLGTINIPEPTKMILRAIPFICLTIWLLFKLAHAWGVG